MNLGRRRFMSGIIALAAAPAIVRAGSLMPVKVLEDDLSIQLLQFPCAAGYLYSELTAAKRRAFVSRVFIDLYTASPTTKWLIKNMQDAIAKDIFEHGSGGEGLLAGMKGH